MVGLARKAPTNSCVALLWQASMTTRRVSTESHCTIEYNQIKVEREVKGGSGIHLGVEVPHCDFRRRVFFRHSRLPNNRGTCIMASNMPGTRVVVVGLVLFLIGNTKFLPLDPCVVVSGPYIDKRSRIGI